MVYLSFSIAMSFALYTYLEFTFSLCELRSEAVIGENEID